MTVWQFAHARDESESMRVPDDLYFLVIDLDEQIF